MMRPVIQTFGYLLSPRVRGFHQALDRPQMAQRRIQTTLCDRLVASEYGRSHNIQSLADWSRLPVVDYDEIRDWIQQQIDQPKAPILTPEPVLFWEKTSGSRGAAKRIPYTRSLRQSFSQLFCVWAHDLIRRGPSFSTGKLYFCVSPKLAETQRPVPIDALQDDSDYLDPWLQRLLSPFWVSLPQLRQLRTAAQFKEALCLRLLSEEQLEIVSIWSPSFWTVQLDYIRAHRDRLRTQLGDRLSANRAQALMQPEIDWTAVWPQLKLISCWDSAAAADPADGLRSQFPGVMVQGKGLLATEAPMTVPLIEAGGDLPLLTEVFFEFEEEGGDLRLLHELETGKDYGIILSQKGGLYRYRMGDRVRVTHRYRETPCLQFVGRSHSVSDLVGEKLHEAFVGQVLASLHLTRAHFKSLVPVWTPQPHYVLLLDQADESEGAIARRLDAALCEAHHYHHARLLGQLAPAQVCVESTIAERLAQHRIRQGQTWGDLKYATLETRPLDRLDRS